MARKKSCNLRSLLNNVCDFHKSRTLAYTRTLSKVKARQKKAISFANVNNLTDNSFELLKEVSTKIIIAMDFRGNDPGAVQYGNFINYYQFNSAEERLKLLPDNIWKESIEENDRPYIVLDIGCNSGDFTQVVYTFLCNQMNRNIFILGIDIDPILIKRANIANTFPNNVTYKCLDIMNANAVEDLHKYLKSFNQTNFNTTFCLSITMWIHLNNGDAGLKTYLDKCSAISKLLVIEPQPWKCYQTAVKRMKKANSNFFHYQTLEWRKDVENQIEEYLENNLQLKKLHETIPTKWKRKISVYKDINKL